MGSKFKGIQRFDKNIQVFEDSFQRNKKDCCE